MTPGNRIVLSADDWAAAALEALGRGGITAVAVEPLAKTLGTTKGSFYWHFAGRSALIEAALARWEQLNTDAIIAAIDANGAAADQLRRLIRLVLSQVTEVQEAGSVELALQANAGDPLVAAALLRVTHAGWPT